MDRRIEYLSCVIVINLCKLSKLAKSLPLFRLKFSRENSIFNVTLHGKTDPHFAGLFCRLVEQTAS